jgi:hypothetical protein
MYNIYNMKREFSRRIKNERKKHKEDLKQLQVNSVFLTSVIQSTPLYLLTGTFIGKNVIISL